MKNRTLTVFSNLVFYTYPILLEGSKALPTFNVYEFAVIILGELLIE